MAIPKLERISLRDYCYHLRTTRQVFTTMKLKNSIRWSRTSLNRSISPREVNISQTLSCTCCCRKFILMRLNLWSWHKQLSHKKQSRTRQLDLKDRKLLSCKELTSMVRLCSTLKIQNKASNRLLVLLWRSISAKWDIHCLLEEEMTFSILQNLRKLRN